MPAKIRLQRKGKKGQPFYHIVIADGRAPREGRFIERIGTYNPLTKPAEIDLNFDKAINWMQKGAQPTDTVKAILSYKGVLYKFHLLQGVKKGAMTPEQAEEKFQAWASEKQAKIVSKIRENELKVKDSKKEQAAYEVTLNEAKAAAVAKKLAKVAFAEAEARKEAIAEIHAKAEVEAEAAAKMKADAHATEEVMAEPKEKVVPEAKEKVVAEPKEKVVAEAKEKGVAGPKEKVVAEPKEKVVAEAKEEVVAEEKEEVAAEPEALPLEPETPAEEPKQE